MHNHVLFGLDDGCRTIEESAQLAEAAKTAGHNGFVATPHIRPGMFENTIDLIKARLDETRPVVERAGLELYLGAEYYFDEQVLQAARKKSLLTLGQSSRFVLAELPQMQMPPRLGDVLFGKICTQACPVDGFLQGQFQGQPAFHELSHQLR